MIAFLDGVVDFKGPDYVVINVGGIGFQVRAASRTIDEIGEPGGRAVLQTCFLMRDDSPVLYGFGSDEELALFRDLISVSGVGPRVGLMLLGALKPEDLAAAIIRGDTELISRVPGVGKRTSARLCVELGPKMERYVKGVAVGPREGDGDLVAALMALGYSLREAVEAAHSTGGEQDLPLEDRLKLALRSLASR
ncbi:MAG: Holliday junction branch migration protein RuvA [Chloroflexi bacterium]|nr:Holliday junction branch migration protein RuvA [Chloroflexota bacterium]